MKPAPFTHHRPASVAHAVELLAGLDDAKVLGGGQSLLPVMNMRLAEPAHLVDVSAVPGMRDGDGGDDRVRLGGAVTHMMIEDGLVPDPTAGLLPAVAAGIGYRAVRTRGTVGGSLAHSDSSAEWPTVLSALDAVVHARSVRGNREIPVRELLTGFFSTTLEDDELIVAVEIARPAAGTAVGFHKLNRKPGEFAESLAVALRRPDGDELWLGAARDVPLRLPATEALVDGRPAVELAVADLVDAVGADTGADGHPRQLHAAAVHRALAAAEREVSRA